MDPPRQKILRRVLSVLFWIAMILGTGPGVLLVNRAETVGGIPLIYAWGILWYVVLVVIAVAAYLWLWTDETDESA